jgi:putative membrane protein
MGEKAKVKETVNLFSKVWQLPSFKRILFNIIISTLVLSLLLSIFQTIKNSIDIFLNTFITYAFVYVISILLGILLMYIVIQKKDSPLDARRTAGAAQFGILFWVILGGAGGLIDLIVSTNHFENRMLMLGVSVAYVFFAFLLNGLSDHHPARTFFAAMIPVILWYSLMVIIPNYSLIPSLPVNWAIIGIGSTLVFTLAVWYIFRAVSHPFERDLGLNGPELLRAFGYDYLMENPEPFEKIIKKISTMQDIPLNIILFKTDNVLKAVGVVLHIHPGPFRDIGSSGLPYAIMKHIEEKYKVHSFVLHGTCTHHQNLTDKEDYPRIMEEIDRLIHETKVSDDLVGPLWMDRGKFKVWALYADSDAVLISTSAPEYTDDIALEVGLEAIRKIKSENPALVNIAIADAHNCINDDAVSVMPGDDDASLYLESLITSVDQSINKKKSSFSLGIAHLVPEGISQKDGMGPGGITALVIENQSEKTCFVVVDGNNVEPKFRELVIDEIKEIGLHQGDILTTDTHLVNAISLSSKGYPPVGRHCPDETLKAIRQTILLADKNLEPMSVGFGFGHVQNLPTYGEKGFDTLTQDIVEAAGIAKRVGIASTGTAFLISLILSFFI